MARNQLILWSAPEYFNSRRNLILRHMEHYGGKFMRRSRSWERGDYFNFAYSALASFRMGMSGSASFQSVRKS
jgi:hypothetical protein